MSILDLLRGTKFVMVHHSTVKALGDMQEAYLVSFLLGNSDTFTNTKEWLAEYIGLGTGTAGVQRLTRIENRLKNKGLLKVQKMQNKTRWTLNAEVLETMLATITNDSSATITNDGCILNNKVNNKDKTNSAERSPQVDIYRQVTGKFPNKKVWDIVTARVGDRTADELLPIYKEYLANGGNPVSLRWLEPNGGKPAGFWKSNKVQRIQPTPPQPKDEELTLRLAMGDWCRRAWVKFRTQDPVELQRLTDKGALPQPPMPITEYFKGKE